MKKIGYTILTICLTLSIIISVAFYLISYKPNHEALTRVRHQIKTLESDIRTEEAKTARAKEAIARMELGFVNLNYFNRSNIPGSEKTPYFLSVINSMANTLGIRFLSIIPVSSEEKKGYVKEAFELSFKTDFRRLLHFLFHLQNTLGLNLDRLNIEMADQEGIPEIKAFIKLNALEMTDKDEQMVRTLEGLREFHIASEPKLMDIKLVQDRIPKTGLAAMDMSREITRDPFIKPAKIQQIQENLKLMEMELQGSELVGIIDFSGQRHAIIGRNTVKKGDRIFNMDVLDITHDKVILGSGDIRFTYHIKKESK